MGLFDGLKLNKLGQKAYNVHLQSSELIKRGKISEAMARQQEALQLYDEAYKAGVRKTDVLLGYAILLMRSGEFVHARELMQEIAKDKSMSEDTHFELRVNYSICLWRLGMLDKAIETIRFAGKYSKNSSYYSSLGTYLVEKAAQTGEFDEAQALLDEAMEYDDEDAATLDNLGQLNRARSQAARADGRGEEAAQLRKTAIDYYELAYKVKPGQITTLYALAEFALEDDDRDRARELVDRAVIHSSSRVCPVSMEMLRELKAKIG